MSDLTFALRSLRKRPLFALVAALSIAIGIGATTAILSVVNALLLRPPAGISQPGRVTEISRTMGGRGRDTFSWPELRDLQERTSDAFSAVSGWLAASLSYAATGEGRRISGLMVSSPYFDVMGVQPLRGRFFGPDDDRLGGSNAVAVVSEQFWRHDLDADPAVLGRTITLNRHTFTIIGIAPASFRGHLFGFQPQVYLPLSRVDVVKPGFSNLGDRRASWLMAVGRLRDGVSVARAGAEAQAVVANPDEVARDPRNARGAAVDPIGAIPAAGRGPLAAFMGVLLVLVGIVLLVTCMNVAGMLTARAAGRSREIAVRLALGSSRARLVRQQVLESVLLFGAGGAGGIGLATLGTRLAERFNIPAPVPILLDFAPDWRVLAGGLALALVTGIVFGLLPALQASRPDLAAAMKVGAMDTGRSGRLRRAFVMVQVGLSVILLLAAGLFARSLQRAAAIPVGFDGAGVATASLDLAIDGYDSTRGRAFVTDLLTRLQGQPGIVAAGLATELPLDLSISEEPTWVPGSPVADDEGRVNTAFNVVTPGYFASLAIPARQGRLLDAQDVAGKPRVAVINRAYASRVWPRQDPIGRHVRWEGAAGPEIEIVGVVDDVKNQMLMENVEPTIWLPLAQQYSSELNLLVRGTSAAVALAALRRVVHEADPALSLGSVLPLDHVTGIGLMPQRLAAGLTSGLGLLALLLSAIGVYGVVALAVAQRTREIGIRMALGARRTDVARMILRLGLRLAVPGLAFGIAGGLLLGRLLRSFILGVPAGDPATFIAMPALLLAAVSVACWGPARRAVVIEPTVALRAE